MPLKKPPVKAHRWETPFFRVARDRFAETTGNKTRGEGVGAREKWFNSRFWAVFWFSCRGVRRRKGGRGDSEKLFRGKWA